MQQKLLVIRFLYVVHKILVENEVRIQKDFLPTVWDIMSGGRCYFMVNTKTPNVKLILDGINESFEYNGKLLISNRDRSAVIKGDNIGGWWGALDYYTGVVRNLQVLAEKYGARPDKYTTTPDCYIIGHQNNTAHYRSEEVWYVGTK